MGFPIADFRYTTRRSAADHPSVYPSLIRDASMLPKLALAMQHFEGMVEQERAACDSDVLMQFFGDPKLARCLIACLGRTYRFIPLTAHDVLTAPTMAHLSTLGLHTSKHLRLWLYDRLNDEHHGFLPSHSQVDLSAAFERELGLRSGEFERLLYLDDDDHAILKRFGARPAPEDIVAQHNVRAIETLLRHAQHVEFSLRVKSTEAINALLRICATERVQASVDGDPRGTRLRLVGRQDAMGNWSRWGRHLARTVFKICERVRPQMDEGRADVVIRDRTLHWKLGVEAVDILAGASTPGAGWDDDDGWDAATIQSASVAGGQARTGWEFGGGPRCRSGETAPWFPISRLCPANIEYRYVRSDPGVMRSDWLS